MTRKIESATSPPKLIVRPSPLNANRAIVQLGHLTFQAAIGRNGRSVFKLEGDGKTPIAQMPLLYGFIRGERMRAVQTSLTLRRAVKSMLWCDAPDDPNYNRLVRGPFKPSHETICREDGLYDVCLVLDWNVRSRQRNRGSAIFMHMIRPGYEPTAGCVALHPRDMRRLLPHLRPGQIVQVV